LGKNTFLARFRVKNGQEWRKKRICDRKRLKNWKKKISTGKSTGKSSGKSGAAACDIDSELLSVETKKIGRSVLDSEIKQEAVEILDSGDEGASVDVKDEVSVKTESCDTGIN
jgi:hypothetical protein